MYPFYELNVSFLCHVYIYKITQLQGCIGTLGIIVVFDQPYFTCEKTKTQKRLGGCLQLCVFVSLVSATNSCVTLGKSLNDPDLSFLFFFLISVFLCVKTFLDEPPKVFPYDHLCFYHSFTHLFKYCLGEIIV